MFQLRKSRRGSCENALLSKKSITDILPAVMVKREISCLPPSWLVVLHGLLFATQTEGLPQVNARHIETRRREVGFLRLAVGKTSNTKGVAETKPLHQLRINVDLSAVPRAKADERRCSGRVFELATAGQALRTFIWRAECRIALSDERELAMDIPVIGSGLASSLG